MLGSPQIRWTALAQLCRRLGTALGAGVDVRRVLEREAQTGKPWQKRQLSQVRDAVARGDALGEAFASTGNYFPRFFLEMLNVGEQTGKLDHILPQLATYYEHLVQLRRVFLIGIAWPAIQLVMAIGVIALLILVLGFVASMTGEETDILGFGLVGVRGLVRYFLGLGVLAAAGLLAYRLCTRGPVAHFLGQALMRVPGLGTNLRMMSLARLAWSLGLALDSGADARQSLRLSLSSTGNSYYHQHVDTVDLLVRGGKEIHEALRQTNAFPVEFLDAVEVGELSGRLSETLLKLASDYRDRAKATMTGVTLFATIAVWGFVGALLIFLIFRIAGYYFRMLDSMLQGL
jgi:type IV pilus assembly protein PilC